MPSQRVLSKEEEALALIELDILLAKHPPRKPGGEPNASAAAREIGIDQQQVSLAKKTRVVRPMLATALAKQYGHQSIGALLEARSGVMADPNDLYKNRAKAIAAAKMLGLPDEAIATVRAKPGFSSDKDPPPLWWFKQIEGAVHGAPRPDVGRTVETPERHPPPPRGRRG